MGKLKVHELAKELGVQSKEIIAKAKELGVEISSHLSNVDDSIVEKIRKKYGKSEQAETKTKNNVKKPVSKKETPVIIRREVILTENEEEKGKTSKKEETRKDVGFVKRRNNNEFNIVYRNKQNKPLTVSELFGLNKKEEPKKKEEKAQKPVNVEKKQEEVKKEIDNKEKEENKDQNMSAEKKIVEPVVKKETVKVEEKKPINKVQERNNDNFQDNRRYNKNNSFNGRNNYENKEQNNNFRNNRNSNNLQNRDGNFRNNRFNNQGNNGGYNKFSNNSDGNGYNRNNFSKNYDSNKEQNFKGNNFRRNDNNQNFRNNGFSKNNSRQMDERKIDKKINDILETEVATKENQRDYSNKVNFKAKNNRFDEQKQNKNVRSRRNSEEEEYDESKIKNLKQVDKLSNMFNEQDGGMLDYYDLSTERGKKGKRKNVKNQEERNKQKIFKLTEITIPENISVKDLATELKKTSSEVITKLMSLGIMANINQELDFDTAFLVAGEFGVTAVKKEQVKEEDILFDESEDKEEELITRPPVVVVMGHVDHGKTSLLDTIRKTNVIGGEAGGITQAIGAYKVKVNDREITFLDTPGHEAFTAMRARGAQITDIAILVVASNDGIMPQTVEAINHAKSAGIPIIVAINKIDLPDANVDKVKQELMNYELVPEEWGGDTICVPISAKNNINIDQLLEMVLLEADVLELKANPNKQAKGVVIEARLDKGKGAIATMLVQRGKLDVGDTIIVGSSIGRIRAMTNENGKKVKSAGPSTPVEIMGLTEVPEAGDTFYEVKDEKTAKHLIEKRKREAREKAFGAATKVTLDNLFEQMEEGNLKVLNLIVKADVQGSVEAVKQSMEKLQNEEVKVKVIHAAPGAVNESDVTLAKVSNAIIIAFNVRPIPAAKEMAEKEEVQIKQYSVIYQAIEEVEAAMKGMLAPKYEEKVIGNAEVRQTFRISNVGTIAGAYVLTGKVERNAGVRVIRDNVVIHEGKLATLKRFKDEAKEVTKGFECGMQIENYNDIKEGDIIEVYIMEEIKR